jgi:hypothetical protein
MANNILEAGSKILQSNAPLHNTTIYFIGFHQMKDNPSQQMEAHHYCKQITEDFAQCILFLINYMYSFLVMKKKMNTYGKTWHVWMTGGTNMPTDALPMGNAMLAWSYNHEGEINPLLVDKRDKQLNISTAQKQQQRIALVKYAKPQQGVDIFK